MSFVKICNEHARQLKTPPVCASKAKEFVREIDKAGKPSAVICHGPWLLISAGLTKGRTMTSYHTIQNDIRNSGANWIDREMVRDRNWVSSRRPAEIPAFNREMIALFSERKARRKCPSRQITVVTG